VPRNEQGFTLCRLKTGRLVRGPVFEGEPTSLRMPVACPAGAAPVGTYHTHPSGDAEPSQQDMDSTRAAGLRFVCVGVPEKGTVRCFDVTQA